MKVTDRFIGDHRTFQKIMGGIESVEQETEVARDHKKLVRLVELLRSHLMIHSWFEDQFYYPAMRDVFRNDRLPPAAEAYIGQMEDEHRAIEEHLRRLEEEVKADPVAANWPQTFDRFARGLRSHMRKEEEELFPASEKLLGVAVLENLSVEMERHRSAAPKVGPHARE